MSVHLPKDPLAISGQLPVATDTGDASLTGMRPAPDLGTARSHPDTLLSEHRRLEPQRQGCCHRCLVDASGQTTHHRQPARCSNFRAVAFPRLDSGRPVRSVALALQ
jgi:hypothetical protein